MKNVIDPSTRFINLCGYEIRKYLDMAVAPIGRAIDRSSHSLGQSFLGTRQAQLSLGLVGTVGAVAALALVKFSPQTMGGNDGVFAVGATILGIGAASAAHVVDATRAILGSRRAAPATYRPQ